MSTSTLALETENITWLTRAADFVELTKPKIGVMVLVAVTVSGYLASWGQPDPWILLNTLAGTLFVASSASAMNQWLERTRDRKMARTASRPLPSGRLSPRVVFAFGVTTLLIGMSHLIFWVNWQASGWAFLTWLIYVAIYTPLKIRSSWNTAVGAVSGALPVLIGWAALEGARPNENPIGITLFFVLFLWQFPHFMAIAWLYREQYRQAGMKMLPVVEPTGRSAGIQAVVFALALVPASLLLAFPMVGVGAAVYLVVAFLLGMGQLAFAFAFFRNRTQTTARWLLRASLVYLPLLLVFLFFLPSA